MVTQLLVLWGVAVLPWMAAMPSAMLQVTCSHNISWLCSRPSRCASNIQPSSTLFTARVSFDSLCSGIPLYSRLWATGSKERRKERQKMRKWVGLSTCYVLSRGSISRALWEKQSCWRASPWRLVIHPTQHAWFNQFLHQYVRSQLGHAWQKHFLLNFKMANIWFYCQDLFFCRILSWW